MKPCRIFLVLGSFLILGMTSLQAQLPQIARCQVILWEESRDRVILAPNAGVHIQAECSNEWHSVPWGNWGVTSNLGHKENGNQFQGWHLSGSGRYHWNSCTSEMPPPDCEFYNHVGCTQQKSTQGYNTHGAIVIEQVVSCPPEFPPLFDPPPVVGCEELDGQYITVSNNFMSLYELDPWDDDELVQSLYFPSLTVRLSCDTYGCTAVRSVWKGPTSFDDPVSPALVDAEISLRVFTSSLDTSYCAACPPCPPDDFCPPCWPEQ